ncbi:hypothetical protein GOBAR_DD11746 [Gossypium barbadense]|nr:hypothetical protein GOBAR_DD11746 [Gossypium barbadense]
MQIFGTQSATKAMRCDQHISLEEYQSTILNGFPPEYDHVTFSATLVMENKSLSFASPSTMAILAYVGQPPPQEFRSNKVTRFVVRGMGDLVMECGLNVRL